MSKELREEIEDVIVDTSLHPVDASLRIVALFDRYAEQREREAVKRYELETSIERLDVQCSEGNCKNCDNKRPRLRKLQEELAALKETTK